MAKPSLNRAGIVSLVCERLRRLQRESEASPFVFVSERGSPFTTAGFARMLERTAAAPVWVSRCIRRAHSSSPWIGGVLGMPFLTGRGCRTAPQKVDLIPAQIDALDRSEAMAVCHEDHGRVTVAMAIAARGLHQRLDLARREVLSIIRNAQ